MSTLTPDQYSDLRAYVGRRVAELVAQGRSRWDADREPLARRAKGEWMIAALQSDPTVARALLTDMIADLYGVPLP
jgi:hypothetical protein